MAYFEQSSCIQKRILGQFCMFSRRAIIELIILEYFFTETTNISESIEDLKSHTDQTYVQAEGSWFFDEINHIKLSQIYVED